MHRAMTYDVVVVGSGGGALVGAFLAQKSGLKTVVLERTTYVVGTSAYSGGSCWLPGSAVQQRAGLPDSTEGARTYLQAILQSPDQAKIEAFLAEAPRLVEVLETEADFGWEWSPFPEYFDAPGRVPMGRSIQPGNVKRDELPEAVATLVRPPVEKDRLGLPGRNTLSGGQALIARALDAFLKAGGTVLSEHRVVRYLQDGGRVTGVEVETEAGTQTIEATAVLVAAGGFEGDDSLRKQYAVPGSASATMAPAGTNAGEPILAGIAIGAAVALMDQGWFCPGLEQPDGRGSFTLGFRGGLMIDQSGNRYANECLPYDRFGREMAKAENRIPSHFIFDSREGGRLPAIAMPEGDPEAHLAAGTWIKADTLGELGSKLGRDNLEATVARFNTFAESGIDEDFGRGTDEYDTFFAPGAGGPNKALVPIDTAPFYAARFVLSDLGTKGGLVTDTRGRVLREDGSVIEGLYATSNSTASVFGPIYPGPGAPLGSAMVFASLAVQDILGDTA